MTTKSQAPRHSLPPKPMAASPSATSDDPHRSLTESCVLGNRDRQMDWSNSQNGGSTWNGHAWSTTPPLPTPALTASSMSSSSLHGERSPILGSSGHGPFTRRNFDIPTMTSLPPAKSFDEAPLPLSGSHQSPSSAHTAHGIASDSYSQYDGAISSLSSSFGALSTSPQQGRDVTGSMDATSLRMASSPHLADPSQQTPMLIPMQPTGAGVELTSVVETLSSRGSKAAAEDPETVAAAYKLSQWGIGIGPGINPKVAASRNGNHSRGRSTASEPPIVNTGNSGPMCVQSGDWICTGCGFVNWRRRDVCMKCFPHADGNEISRGIQSGETLAKRLAAGLDTDTDEYRQSVQALCPDKEKRVNSYMPRPPVHALPPNPMQAYGGSSQGHHHQRSSSTHVHPSNVLGIHMSSAEQLQWRQQTNRQRSMTEQFAGQGYYQQRITPGQMSPPGASSLQQLRQCQQQQQQQQQQRFGGDPNHVDSPYKAYTPWKPMPGASDNSVRSPTQQRPTGNVASPTPTAAGRASLFRSATYAGEDLAFKHGGSRQASAPHGGNNSTRAPATGWSSVPEEPSPGLPRDIWAPAPKQAALVPVDPEDVSREKRAQPEPIGTRSSRSGSGAASTSTTTGGTHLHLNLESTGPKDDKQANNAFVDYWISDSLTAPPPPSAASTATCASATLSSSASISAPVSASLSSPASASGQVGGKSSP
ncbi:Zinc finger, RanBP2-type [Kalmanozyma brasiliensis GHG001]|uniref:RanBP2-type domain-containing protein n=1 Tax=Kalmanozyma brasiliensis (strain GHG001) TaxID=1365824 RepID=V5ELK3_KALBG|nr:Zinc finger, RanBP2-type [Kalmanozyma brasiliensis GHG001]EST05945.1 Zinc finger, RanBP2-type [Kalmanozyma brasiliensis GHG001]